MKENSKKISPFQKKTVAKYIFVYTLIFYPLFLWFVFRVCLSASTVALAFQTVVDGELQFCGLKNFVAAIKNITADPLMNFSFVNSMIKFWGSIVISMPLYMLVAYYVYKKAFAAKVLQFIIMSPMIISGMLIVLLFKRFCEDIVPMFLPNLTEGLLEGRSSFFTTWFYTIWISFATNILVYPNAMNAIDPELVESAKLDGANALQEFWHVLLPGIYPTLSTFVITGFTSLFTDQGPLLTFFMYSAPAESFNMGYYIFTQVMDPNAGTAQYAYTSSISIMIALVTTPIVMLVKNLMENYGPTEEDKGTRKFRWMGKQYEHAEN